MPYLSIKGHDQTVHGAQSDRGILSMYLYSTVSNNSVGPDNTAYVQ